MKRSDLKKLIKPLVKECIQESLIEEGLLSGVISEVVKGLNTTPIVMETKAHNTTPAPTSGMDHRVHELRQQMEEDKRKLISSFKQETFNGVDIFEGTKPLSNYESGATKTTQGGALSGMDPGDPGVDISGIMALGAKNWKALIS
tara:strand:- start:96 stop:530 length:435 start_codon:yes stop_codon:yes gene_type:complete